MLTVASAAKGGAYTVTLTREPSVARQITICRSGAKLTDADVLRIPDSGTIAYPYTAEVIDQYGTVFETDVVWSVSGSSSGVNHENGIITLNSTAGA